MKVSARSAGGQVCILHLARFNDFPGTKIVAIEPVQKTKPREKMAYFSLTAKLEWLTLVRPAATAGAHSRSRNAFGEETLTSCLTRVGGPEISLGSTSSSTASMPLSAAASAAELKPPCVTPATAVNMVADTTATINFLKNERFPLRPLTERACRFVRGNFNGFLREPPPFHPCRYCETSDKAVLRAHAAYRPKKRPSLFRLLSRAATLTSRLKPATSTATPASLLFQRPPPSDVRFRTR